MNILLLNQCFYPDVAATGQYLTDLAIELTERGHSVTVVTSNRGYDDPARRFPRRETWRGIKIIRLWSLSPGKEKRWQRALNFGSFLSVCALRLLFLPKFDAVLALTSPPLISFLGSLFVQLKGGKLFFWIMDLNPDEAIAAGWLNESSITARLLSKCLAHSLRVAEKTIVLDRFMKMRIVDKGVSERKIVVAPPWSLTTDVRFDQQGRLAFRERYGLSQKFVVMYAGNHSPCHPLGTLLEAALQLSPRNEIAFCFVGGGSELKKVQAFAAQWRLNNITCVPYQSLDQLAGTLSAADLHVVVMGERFVGIVHPCKIYNVLAVGSPFLYIGPEESHITDIARKKEIEDSTYLSSHGASELVAKHITRAVERHSPDGRGKAAAASAAYAIPAFARESLLREMIDLLERASTTSTIEAAVVSQTSV